MPAEPVPDRRLLRLTGADAREFLQGLVCNDVSGLDRGLVYTALLTPQGKYLADFFLVPQGEAIVIDGHAALAEGLERRLAMYRLRADVRIEPCDLAVTRGLGTLPDGAYPDPRSAALGWRGYGIAVEDETGRETDWDALRVANCIPESGIELIPDETFILEAGFERLNGVDFRKGCYVGQEVTARMKHKTELRKGLRTVSVQGAAPVGTELLTPDGKTAGRLFTQAAGQGIAYLRLDRAKGPLTAGEAIVTL